MEFEKVIFATRSSTSTSPGLDLSFCEYGVYSFKDGSAQSERIQRINIVWHYTVTFLFVTLVAKIFNCKILRQSVK